MAAITGITGEVTSWANNTQLAVTGTKPGSLTLTMDGDDIDVTEFSTTGSESHIKGLSSWKGSFEAQLAAPAIGALGLVTFSAGYVTLLDTWTMAIKGNAHEVTAFSATEKAFIPGLYSWSGGFSGFLDDTTVVKAVGNTNEPATGTFQYQDVTGATENTLSGSIFTTNLNLSATPSDANKVSYSYRGSGALTQSTPSSGQPVLSAGALVVAVPGSLVLTASTGRTFTGSAFWTGITFNVNVQSAVTVTVEFQGTGALAIG